MATITILYPTGHDFDLDYYMATHMPLVSETWKPLGLQSWEITTLQSGQPFQVQATLKWDSLDSWTEGSTGESSKIVFGDIPKFTTAKPTVLQGSHKGSEGLA